MAVDENIVKASGKYPKPTDRTFQYGTAGVCQILELFNQDAKMMLIQPYIVSHEVVSSPLSSILRYECDQSIGESHTSSDAECFSIRSSFALGCWQLYAQKS